MHHARLRPLRVHDLRATFVTLSLANGRGESWVADRTGHLTPTMRARYARAARVLADLKYEPFPDLTGTVTELAKPPANVVPITRKAR